MLILATVVSGLLMFVQPEPAGVGPAVDSASSAPSHLARFSERDQRIIADAAKHFVVDRQGVYWDLQAEDRRAELLADKERESRLLEPYGIGRTAVWKTVPLWHAAAAERTIYDPDIIAGLRKAATDGFEPSDDVFVCTTVVSDREAVAEHWIYTPGETGDRPNYRKSDRDVLIRGHSFDKPGDELRLPLIKRGTAIQMGAKKFPVIEIAPASALRAAFRPVDADELAEAIMRGEAKLTRWMFEHRTVPESERGPKRTGHITENGQFYFSTVSEEHRKPRSRYIWRSKDVTPSPLPALESKP